MSIRIIASLALCVAISALCETRTETAKPKSDSRSRTEYLLGPRDELTVTYTEADQKVEQSVQVNDHGDINLALIGRVAVVGLTTRQVEDAVARKLEPYVKGPEVSVQIKTFQSQPVSIIGAVATPGVQYMKGPTTLVEALALAGGAAVDSGNTVKVTRRLGENGRIPLAEAKDDADAGLSIAEISLETVLKEDGSDQNIVIRPHDIISVSRAQLVYVVGEVTRAGGFPLNERKKMSVLQALTLAGGLTQDAAPKSAKILRQPEGSAQRVETAVNVRNILNGQEPDRELAANDILFVPGNSTKRVSRKLLETAIGTASGVVIYRSARY